MQNFFEKLQHYSIIFGILGLIMGIINSIKGEAELARTGFFFLGIAFLFFLLSIAFSRLSEKVQKKNKPGQQSPAPLKVAATEPLTILGMVILLQHPLRFANDKDALLKSIFFQQEKEFGRVIAPSAQVQVTIAGASLDDEAYVYGICRSAFDGLSTYTNNDEFLQRVATGSFTASDGNKGKHYTFLNRKL
jgi:hypothetical protein